MKINNKGMTLIEVVVSLLILSTASLIMVTGFTTAINTFSDANSYKNAANKEKKALLTGETEGTSVYLDQQDAKYVITVDNGSSPFEVKGKYKKATVGSENNVSLSNFEIGTDDTRKAKAVYTNTATLLDDLYNYLKANGSKDSNKLFVGTTEYTMKKWLQTKYVDDYSNIDDINGKFVLNLPYLYSCVYPDVEIDTLSDVIQNTNSSYNKNEYKYVLPCMFMNSEVINNIKIGEFFGKDENGKKGYEKYLHIVIDKKPQNGYVPENIWALYNNASDSKDIWFIPSTAMSTSELTDGLYENTKQRAQDENWLSYTTKEGDD